MLLSIKIGLYLTYNIANFTVAAKAIRERILQLKDQPQTDARMRE